MTTEITETGTRGFLLWLKEQQPAVYAKIAPQVSAQLPQAFSGYHDGGWKTAGMSKRQLNRMMNRLSGFGSFGDDTSDFIDISNDLQPVQVTAQYIPPTVDVAAAANNSSMGSDIASALSSLVSGASALYMTKQQLNIQQQVVNTQLQRAAAGLPPLPTSLSNLGVPQVSVGLTAGTGVGIALAGGALLLFLMFGSKRKSRA